MFDINIYIMNMLTALLLFAVGVLVSYALVRLKDHENDE